MVPVGAVPAVPASMRPRVFPAEDPPVAILLDPPYLQASMRPRVFPAEDFRASLGPSHAS